MGDKGEIDETGSSDSALRGAAEEKLGKSLDASSKLGDKTSEAIIHELQVHQTELQMQNEELKRVQHELEESRSNYRGKYQDLYDFAPVGYFTLTPKGLITEVNLTGATHLGMPRPKLIGRGFGHFISPKSLDLWDKHIISVFGHEDKQTCDLRLKREDESSFYARLNSIRVVVPNERQEGTGETHLIHMAVTDVTDWMWAEKSLEESNAFLDTLLESIPLPIFYKDTDGLFTGFNKAFEEFYGKTRQELTGKSVFDIYPEELAKVYYAKDNELFRNPGIQIYNTPIKDGRGVVHDIIFHKSTYSDSQGHVLGLIGVIIDITERKREEEKNLRLAAIVDSSDDAIIGKTLDGTITSWNRGAERIYGYKEDEVIGKSITILAPHDCEDEIRELLEQIKNGKSVKHIETVRRRKDGNDIPVSITISPIIDKEGHIIGASTITRDITDSVKAAQQREALQEQLLQAQKMEAIGTLAGGFAHDFNNKLQVIGGYVDVILFNKDLSETLKHDLGIIRQAVDSSSELIKGMMVFSRKTPTELQPIELNKLVAQTRSMLTRSIPKMIEIDLLLADDLWPINAAPNQIDQILMNLAVNASDAMPDGGKLTIKTNNIVLDEKYCRFDLLAKPGRYALITVSDTGVGMNKETASRIFEPFFTTKEPGKGTGLGLSIVYGIVEQHGGRIICDSEPSVGTTFRIYFPAIEGVPQQQYSEKKEPPRGQGETILVVDDEVNITEFTSRMLAKANYGVITASNGTEALELYEKHQEEVKLVILDLIMPKMGGEECLQTLLTMDPKIRVLVASGALKEGRPDDSKLAGAKGFIKKPFDMPRMLEKIRRIIDED